MSMEDTPPLCVICQESNELYRLLGHDSLGHRTGNALTRAGITTVAALRQMTDKQILLIRSIHEVALRRIHERVDHCTQDLLPSLDMADLVRFTRWVSVLDPDMDSVTLEDVISRARVVLGRQRGGIPGESSA
jgi:hypothetical protein